MRRVKRDFSQFPCYWNSDNWCVARHYEQVHTHTKKEIKDTATATATAAQKKKKLI